MPLGSVMQTAFTAGELSPNLWARLDLSKYHLGARMLRNFFVHAAGGVSNRAGTSFCGRTFKQGKAVRLVPFSFSTTQTYVLELGDLYMRVIMNGGYVLEPTFSITAITTANPAVVTVPGHNYVNGDWVYIASAGGMPLLNSTSSRIYIVANVTASTLTLTTLDGAPINSSTWGAYTGGGTIARLYTLTTPWVAADIAMLKWTQSADTMTLTHTGYQPYDLTRTQHWAWTLTPITFQPSITAPVISGVSNNGTSNGTVYRYVVTAVDANSGEESRPSAAGVVTGQNMSAAATIRNVVNWSAIANAGSYKVYRQKEVIGSAPDAGELYGYVGHAIGSTFTDNDIVPDFTRVPPTATNPFNGAGNYPACVAYFQQRKAYAGTLSKPTSFWLTKTGALKNMDVSSPAQPNDAINNTVATQQVNAINYLLPMSNGLIALTTGGAFQISGASGDAVTPTNIQAKPQSFTGASARVPPLAIGYDILYVQNKGASVRDLSYNFYASLYTGADLSVLSDHLFYGYQILEWDYAEEPFKAVWAIRNDGDALCLTYLKDQEVYAWSRHDTGANGSDSFKSVAVIGEGQEDVVYFVVQRTIPGINGGQPVQYVERMHSRNFMTNGAADVTKGWFVDCGIQYSGAPTATITGLDHLEGLNVAILCDGNVQAPLTVQNGQITMQQPGSVVTVGIPYQAQFQSLDIDTGSPGNQGKRQRIVSATMRLKDSRGLKVGHDFQHMHAIKERNSTIPMGAPIPLVTGDEFIIFDPAVKTQGVVCAQQDDPLPCTITGLIPNEYMGN